MKKISPGKLFIINVSVWDNTSASGRVRWLGVRWCISPVTVKPAMANCAGLALGSSLIFCNTRKSIYELGFRPKKLLGMFW